MKSRFAAVFLATAAALVAQEAAQPFQLEALLVEKEGGFQKVWIVAGTKTQVRYKETEVAVETKDARISDYSGVYLYEPKDYTAALDLYQARKYAEAREAFAKVKDRCKSVAAMDNNPAALATFYEMECMRRMGDLEALNTALGGKFTKDPLTRESQLRQFEIYVMWDAVRTKSWDRLDILAKERDAIKLPGDQRAQVAYCHGLALEGLGRPAEALGAYATAMTADAAASEELAREAALRTLAIHKADPLVQQAIKVWGTKDENKNSPGYAHLNEAGAVASLYELSLGAGKPLPDEYKALLKYKPKVEDVVAPGS
jgi:tetratricopeptide (TPR) repeat protein